MTWLLYVDIVVTIFSICLIGATVTIHIASRKLHRVHTLIALMQMQEQGTLMWWRKRALDAEGELRRLKGQ